MTLADLPARFACADPDTGVRGDLVLWTCCRDANVGGFVTIPEELPPAAGHATFYVPEHAVEQALYMRCLNQRLVDRDGDGCLELESVASEPLAVPHLTPAPLPEPNAFLLLVVGLLVVAALSRVRR